jgi:hypothetical protein
MMTRRRNHHAMLSVSLLHSRMSHMPSKGRTGVGHAHRVSPDREGEAERAAVAANMPRMLRYVVAHSDGALG